LRWADITDRVIHVERALALGAVKETKTRKTRAVRLLRPLADDLKVWREVTAGQSTDLVFPATRGIPWTDYDYRNWRKRRFEPAVAVAGVEIGRPYDLRHAFISLLLAEGRSVVYVASQAGHAPTMTLDTYAHVIEELEDGEPVIAADAIYAARALVPEPFPRPPRGTALRLRTSLGRSAAAIRNGNGSDGPAARALDVLLRGLGRLDVPAMFPRTTGTTTTQGGEMPDMQVLLAKPTRGLEPRTPSLRVKSEVSQHRAA
jgi:hypothetical protein